MSLVKNPEQSRPRGEGGGARKARFVVLVSGNGGNLQALLDAIAAGAVNASIVLVLSSDPDAFALKRAEAAGIPSIALPYNRDQRIEKEASRIAFDTRLADEVSARDPDYIFLLGWMRILGMAFIGRFPGKIVNLHPALPGCFPGTHAIERAWEACARAELSETGVMTHFVPDELVDAGPVILSERVKMKSNETLADFEFRMHETEHELVVKTARMLASIAAGDGKGER